MLYKQYSSVKARLADLHDLAKSRERDVDLLRHQIKELEQVPLTEEDLAEIERDREIIALIAYLQKLGKSEKVAPLPEKHTAAK